MIFTSMRLDEYLGSEYRQTMERSRTEPWDAKTLGNWRDEEPEKETEKEHPVT